MNIRKSLSALFHQDYLFSVFSKITGVFIAVVYSAFYNRYLGTYLKGDAAIISNYISLISAFMALGMYQAYPYYRKKDKNVFYPFVNNMTSLYLILTIACVIAAGIMPVNVNLKFAICFVPIQAFIRHINYVVMIEAPQRRNVSSIIISLTDLVVVLAFFFFSKATYGYLIAILLIQNLINLGISFANLKVDLKMLRFDLSEVLKYASYGILPMFTLMLLTLNYRVDILMLEDLFHVPKSEIGVYSVGVALAEKIWLVPDALKDILMSHLAGGRDKEEVAKVTRMSLCVVLFMLAGMVFLGKPFILLLYGAEYSGAYEILIIMLVGVIGMVFYKMVYAYNVVNGNRTVNLLFLALAAILNIIGNYFSIPIGGIAAAAWASVLSYTVCGFAYLVYFCTVEKVKVTHMLFIRKEDIHSALLLIKH